MPHAVNTVDFVISIAVVHHLSTPARRQEAIKTLLEPLKEDGRALVYVWALEQSNSRRGWTEHDEQDVMVPWVLRGGKQDSSHSADAHSDKTFFRYYHLYRRGELENDIHCAGGKVIDAGYEKDNWWAIMTKTKT